MYVRAKSATPRIRLAPSRASAMRTSVQVSTWRGMTRPLAASMLIKRSIDWPNRCGTNRANPMAAKKLT